MSQEKENLLFMLWLSRWLPSHRPHCFSCCRETDCCGTVLAIPDDKGGGTNRVGETVEEIQHM